MAVDIPPPVPCARCVARGVERPPIAVRVTIDFTRKPRPVCARCAKEHEAAQVLVEVVASWA